MVLATLGVPEDRTQGLYPLASTSAIQEAQTHVPTEEASVPKECKDWMEVAFGL